MNRRAAFQRLDLKVAYRGDGPNRCRAAWALNLDLIDPLDPQPDLTGTSRNVIAGVEYAAGRDLSTDQSLNVGADILHNPESNPLVTHLDNQPEAADAFKPALTDNPRQYHRMIFKSRIV